MENHTDTLPPEQCISENPYTGIFKGGGRKPGTHKSMQYPSQDRTHYPEAVRLHRYPNLPPLMHIVHYEDSLMYCDISSNINANLNSVHISSISSYSDIFHTAQMTNLTLRMCGRRNWNTKAEMFAAWL